MNASQWIQSLWQRLGGRTQVRPPRPRQRLTGFEPLEPRTVLSVGMPMFGGGPGPGGGGFGNPSRNDWYHGEPNGRPMAAAGDFAGRPEWRMMSADRFERAAMLTAPPRETAIVPAVYSDASAFRPLPTEPVLSPRDANVPAARAEGEAPTTLTIVTTYVAASPAFLPELFVVRNVGSVRVAAENYSSVSAADNRIFALPVINASFERRSETAPVYAPIRESGILAAQSRTSAASAVVAETEGTTKFSEPAVTQRLAATLMLSQSSIGQTDSIGHIASAAREDDSRLDERPLDRQASAESETDETGMVELSSADWSRQKRKTGASESASRGTVAPRLERLADLPFARDARWFFRELARLADDSNTAASPAQAPAAQLADDGMVELLAADLSSLMVPRSDNGSGGAVPGGMRVATLEAGVALYQAFDIDMTAGDASGDAIVGAEAVPAAAPAVEQLTRAE